MQKPAPNLFLVGAPKCGTTSLYEYLRRHPQIFFPADENDYWRAKEPNHLCPEMGIVEKYSIKDPDAYLRLYLDSADATWRGDASPYYLASESAPSRIKRMCPNARILITLRPPVAMMRSYHRDLLRLNLEDISDFYTAIDAGDDGGNEPDRRRPAFLDYRLISHFATQVERYHGLFGKDSVKVVLLEDIVADPAATFRDILSFLGVDISFQPEFKVHNETPRDGVLERVVTSVYTAPLFRRAFGSVFPWRVRRGFLLFIRRIDKSDPRDDPRDDRLRRLYVPEVQRLATQIGRNLDHWQPQGAR